MFFLISFVFSRNYCIETINGNCNQICANHPEKFDNIFSYIPKDDEINTNNNEIHNFYIANDVPYFDSSHNYIFCDSSVHLVYEKNISSLQIKDHIYVDSDEILRDAPIIFKINSSLIVKIDTEKKLDSAQVILEPTREIILSTRFYVEEFPENLISISQQSKRIRVDDLTDKVLKVYNNTQNFILNRNIAFYCITDKPHKCSNYNYPSMKYAYSMSEIVDLAAYVIVDTSEPQTLNYVYGYYHIFLSKGSSVTYSTSHYFDDSEFYVILHSKSIEMNNLLFKGEGSITLFTRSNISVLSTTKKCDIDLALKTYRPFELEYSFIHSIKDDFSINMEKKIHVPDYSLYRGPKNLKELFEPDKFLRIEDEYRFDNLTGDQLKEYDYTKMLYFFKPGIVEVPLTWKKTCRLHGHKPNETTFIYSDVHVFETYLIDNFIDCNMGGGGEIKNNITIKPSHRFYFDSFELNRSHSYNANYTIVIDKDIYFYGHNYPKDNFDEFDLTQCRIVGNGNIMFNDSSLLTAVQNICRIDENVHLIHSVHPVPKVYACVGQSSLEKCKSEIPDIDLLEDYEWIWLRNLKTCKFFRDRNKVLDIEKTFLTDKHEFIDDYYIYEIKYDFILTAKADITYEVESSAYYNKRRINVYKNQIDTIVSLKNTAKLTYFLLDFEEINLFYHENPTEIDFGIVLYNKNHYLYMNYVNNYIPNSISLTGECDVYVRDYLLPKMNLFEKQDTINCLVNNKDYHQILYSDDYIENTFFNDFYLCNSFEKFINYANKQDVNVAIIYKNIELQFSSNIQNFNVKHFYFYNGVTITIDVPNDALLFINSSLIIFGVDEIENTTYYYLHNENSKNKFILNVKELINIDIDNTSSYIPIIELAGPKHTVEVFSNISLIDIKNFIINVNENLTIVSPYPQYLYKIFGSTPVNFSPRWSYLYLSESGKNLFQSNPIQSYKMIDNDENLMENIVLAVSKNDVFSISPKWKQKHNIFIIQEEDDLYIDQPSTIAFLHSGLLLNDQIRFISGSISILVKDNFTLLSKNEILDKFDKRYLYEVKLDFNENENDSINIYIDSFDDRFNRNIPIIYDYQDYNISQVNVIFYYKKIKDWRNLDLYLGNIHLYEIRCYYDYLCFGNLDSDIYEKCPKDNLIITSIPELNKAMIEFPEVPIIVASDAEFYNPHINANVDIYSTNENIKLSFPNNLYTFELTNKNEILLDFRYSFTYTIKNTANIYLEVNDTVYFRINGYSYCDVTFVLNSDVMITKYSSDTDSNLFISVINNSYHLYSEDYDDLVNVFDDSLEPYTKKCAYDSGRASLYCDHIRGDYFDNVFNESVNYDELRIIILYYQKEIELPPVSNKIRVRFDYFSKNLLTIKNISTIDLSNAVATINKYWEFDTQRDSVTFKLDNYTILSFNNKAYGYIHFQLTKNESYIELRNCSYRKTPCINIYQYGNEINKLTIIGTFEEYEYFMNLLLSYVGIDIIFYHTNEHYCICNNENSCKECKLNINGTINTNNKLTNDPGLNVNIRIFSNTEVSSKTFTNEHNVFIDENTILNLTDVDIVYQNINEGIKIDKLVFDDTNRILLKPKQSELKIAMNNNKPGPDLYVNVNKLLKLNVINSNEENLKASNIFASGSGDLYANNYPFDKITNIESVKIYKGVYIMCNESNSQCNYDSIYENLVLAIYNHFTNIFDSDTKVIVFIFSFGNSIDVDLSNLNGQKMEFNRNSLNSIHLLKDQNKLRFTTTTELINNEDSTTELANSIGGVLLENFDSDLFVVGFDKNLTIKQKGNISSNTNKITIQPMSDEVTIFIDDSVDIEKQKIRIEPDGEKEIKVNVIASKNIKNKELLKNFIENDDNKVSLVFSDPINSENNKKKFPVGAIIGIVVGVVVVIIVVTLITIIILKKKKGNESKQSNELSEEQFDDSTF